MSTGTQSAGPRALAAARPNASIDPRVRERWIAARRAEGRRRLRIVIAVVVVVAIGVGAWGVTRSPLLDVDRVVVSGQTRVAAAEIVAASDVRVGDSLVWLDPGRAAARVEAIPWVRTARAVRERPHVLRIAVTERSVVAWVDAGGALLVDRTGRVLERADRPPPGIPKLVGVQRVPVVGGTIRPPAVAAVAGALGDAAGAFGSVAYSNGNATAQLVGGPEVRLGSPRQLEAKVRAALAVVAALGSTRVTYVDVSAPSVPVAG